MTDIMELTINDRKGKLITKIPINTDATVKDLKYALHSKSNSCVVCK